MTAETGVKWLLRIISITTIPALVAAVMPPSWLADMLHWMDPEFSLGLLESYITRCLMGVYALLGVQAVIWSTNVRRYRPLIMSLCVCAIVAALIGLTALLTTIPSNERDKIFWIIFIDLAEGLAHTLLLTILILRVSVQKHQY